MAYYPKRRTTFKGRTARSNQYATPRRPAYSGAKRRTAMTRSFGAAVKKADLAQAQEKNVSACFMNHDLHLNRWYKGHTVSTVDGKAVTPYKIENMFADITPGTNEHQRVSDELYLQKLSLRMFLSSPAKVGSCITYHIIVYYTPNGVIGSTRSPILLQEGIDAATGFNNLLCSVDKRAAHVIFEKLIVPGKNGILSNSNTVSQIEDINFQYQSQTQRYFPKPCKHTWCQRCMDQSPFRCFGL